MNLLFIYLALFDRTATGVVTDDDMQIVEQRLVADPHAGAVVAGTGGARKLRVALPGRGKRGGARLIYLYIAIDQEVYFIRAYAKNRKGDLTADEKREIAAVVRQIREED